MAAARLVLRGIAVPEAGAAGFFLLSASPLATRSVIRQTVSGLRGLVPPVKDLWIKGILGMVRIGGMGTTGGGLGDGLCGAIRAARVMQRLLGQGERGDVGFGRGVPVRRRWRGRRQPTKPVSQLLLSGFGKRS